mgnify:CR=1 FL=1
MAVNDSVTQNLLPVQAYFDLQGNFQTFIGQNKPFFATISPYQSGLVITNSTIDSTTIGATTPSTGVSSEQQLSNLLTTTNITYSIAGLFCVSVVCSFLFTGVALSIVSK